MIFHVSSLYFYVFTVLFIYIFLTYNHPSVHTDRMDTKALHLSIEQEARFTFARSGGPGGQNVNKVNTKVFISVNINCLQGLSVHDISRISSKLSNRLDVDGVLTISVEDERSQYRNREIALERIEALILRANFQEKKRIPTKPGKAAKLRRLGAKQIRSHIKTNRVQPSHED